MLGFSRRRPDTPWNPPVIARNKIWGRIYGQFQRRKLLSEIKWANLRWAVSSVQNPVLISLNPSWLIKIPNWITDYYNPPYRKGRFLIPELIINQQGLVGHTLAEADFQTLPSPGMMNPWHFAKNQGLNPLNPSPNKHHGRKEMVAIISEFLSHGHW